MTSRIIFLAFWIQECIPPNFFFRVTSNGKSNCTHHFLLHIRIRLRTERSMMPPVMKAVAWARANGRRPLSQSSDTNCQVREPMSNATSSSRRGTSWARSFRAPAKRRAWDEYSSHFSVYASLSRCTVRVSRAARVQPVTKDTIRCGKQAQDGLTNPTQAKMEKRQHSGLCKAPLEPNVVAQAASPPHSSIDSRFRALKRLGEVTSHPACHTL